MRKFIASFLTKLLEKVTQDSDTISVTPEPVSTIPASTEASEPLEKVQPKELKPKKIKGPKPPPLSPQEIAILAKERAARDIAEMMEVPFLALSKNRKEPIIYEKHDGPNMIKVKVSRHVGHFLASIYDWDIVLFVAGKMQEIINNGSDIPPRTITVPRHELLKALKKHDGKAARLELKASLSRLQLTGIETTIRNEDGRYDAGFGFLESWGYTKREDIREISIILSNWLYEGICAKGSLLMVDSEYFSITSALKRFLYRTARKHVGGHGKPWEFLVETLHEKSGSERDFRFFKRDLKTAVLQNDIPGYHLEWVEKGKKTFVSFQNLRKIIELMGPNDKVKEQKPPIT
jgi:plasmid replication initiation protein